MRQQHEPSRGADVAPALTPMYDAFGRQVTAATYLQTDDTPAAGVAPQGSALDVVDPLARQIVFDASPAHERNGPGRFWPVISRRTPTPFRVG